MAFLSTLDIAGSAMTAQKRRLDTITENITNRETTRTDSGDPYRRKLTVFREIQTTSTGISARWNSPFANRNDDFATRLRYLQSRHEQKNGGVMVSEIIEDQSDFKAVYDPNHPDADENGYVMMPNVDTTMEMVDAMAATRSFSANVAVFEAIKMITNQALELGK